MCAGELGGGCGVHYVLPTQPLVAHKLRRPALSVVCINQHVHCNAYEGKPTSAGPGDAVWAEFGTLHGSGSVYPVPRSQPVYHCSLPC